MTYRCDGNRVCTRRTGLQTLRSDRSASPRPHYKEDTKNSEKSQKRVGHRSQGSGIRDQAPGISPSLTRQLGPPGLLPPTGVEDRPRAGPQYTCRLQPAQGNIAGLDGRWEIPGYRFARSQHAWHGWLKVQQRCLLLAASKPSADSPFENCRDISWIAPMSKSRIIPAHRSPASPHP